MRGILGKKLGMTRIIKEDGTCLAVTSISAGPCVVVQIKSKDADGYRAVQLGFAPHKPKRVNKPLTGHYKKASLAPQRFLREIRLSDDEQFEPGQQITADIFQEGEFVDVTGVSIGKGFQGGMKRWNWSGGPGSHGSMTHRRVGSMGTNTTPGRVLRGHHMPGHMGNDRVTVQNLQVVKIDTEQNLMMIKGAVPGHKGAYVVIRKAKKK